MFLLRLCTEYSAPRDSSQPSETGVPRDLMPFSVLQEQQACKWCAYLHERKKNTHAYKIRKTRKNSKNHCSKKNFLAPQRQQLL